MLALLYKTDKEKKGINYVTALEAGLNFKSPTIKIKYNNRTIFKNDKYMYEIVNNDNTTLIIVYHESEF